MPSAPPWRAGILEWYADGAPSVDELPDGYRPFDRSWAADGSGDIWEPHLAQRHMWMYRFNRLGVLETFGVADSFRP